MKIINVDRAHGVAAFGGLPSEHDRAIVVSTYVTERHPITGQSQPVTLFRGTLTEAHAYVKAMGGAS